MGFFQKRKEEKMLQGMTIDMALADLFDDAAGQAAWERAQLFYRHDRYGNSEVESPRAVMATLLHYRRMVPRNMEIVGRNVVCGVYEMISECKIRNPYEAKALHEKLFATWPEAFHVALRAAEKADEEDNLVFLSCVHLFGWDEDANVSKIKGYLTKIHALDEIRSYAGYQWLKDQLAAKAPSAPVAAEAPAPVSAPQPAPTSVPAPVAAPVTPSADDADVVARFEEGLALSNGGQFEAGHRIFEECAARGYARAYNAMGVDYREGEGVKADGHKAMECFVKAFEGGYPNAASNISFLYQLADDYGIEKDDDKAFYYTKAAAMNGDADCMGFLGQYYYRGIGCERNYKLAAYWSKKGYDGGSTIPNYILSQLFFYGDFYPDNMPYARFFLEKYAAASNCDAEEFLPEIEDEEDEEYFGPLNRRFMEVKAVEPHLPDFEDAAPDFFTAPDAEALYLEGIYYAHGHERAVDAAEAERLITLAADAGHSDAMFSLATKYLNTGDGDGVRYDEDGVVLAFGEDTDKALHYLTRSAAYGNIEAVRALAELYTFGEIDIEPNYERAKEYWLQTYKLTQDPDIKKNLQNFDEFFQLSMSDFAREDAVEKYLTLGQRAVEAGDYEEAANHFKKAYTRFRSGEAAYRMATMMMEQDNYKAGVRWFTYAEELQYGDAFEQRQMAEAALELENFTFD